jgi:phosphatidylglycerophosphate synthase
MLLPVIPVIVYIWYLYEADFGWRFDVSILLINLLIVLTLAIHWYKTTAWYRYDFTESTLKFLQHLVARLKFIKWLSYTGSLIYVVSIWLIFVLYIWEVGQDMEPLQRNLILIAVSLWVGISYFWGVWRQRKKDAVGTNPLLEELEALLKKLEY